MRKFLLSVFILVLQTSYDSQAQTPRLQPLELSPPRTLDLTTGLSVCDGKKVTAVVPITSKTGRVWMDRNLGANRAATSSTDYKAYGCLYQWGRGNDGHASMNWTSSVPTYDMAKVVDLNSTTKSVSTTDVPGHNLFILPTYPWNWRNPANNLLWKSAFGSNNPCPTNYRIPTEDELNAEFAAYGITDTARAFRSPFKFVAAGLRYSSGTYSDQGSSGNLWTSSVPFGTQPIVFRFFQTNSSTTGKSMVYQATGNSVRCIRN